MTKRELLQFLDAYPDHAVIYRDDIEDGPTEVTTVTQISAEEAAECEIVLPGSHLLIA